MPWIIDETINKPRFVALGSGAMRAAKNCYETESQARAAHREICPHPTILANSSTRVAFCADCGQLQ